MKNLLIVFLLLTVTVTTAQIKFSMDMTDERLSRLQKSKDARTKLERYRKMYSKDSLKAYKKRQKFLRDSLGSKRQFKKYKDSLQQVMQYSVNPNRHIGRALVMKSRAMRYKNQLDSTLAMKSRVETYKNQLDSTLAMKFRVETYQNQLDSAKGMFSNDSLRGLYGDRSLIEMALLRDSLGLASPDSLQGMGVMAKYGMYGTMMETYMTRKGLPTDSSSLVQQLALEERVKAYLPEELQGEQSFDSFQNGLLGAEEVNQDNPTGALMENLSPEQMQAATTAMMGLKKGYISVSNTSDLSTAKKRNSLKGAPFRRKLYLGGNVALKSFKPVIMDVDIQVGYKFNRDFFTGVGFIIREQFSDQPSALVGDAYGHSLFVNYDLPLGIFAYGEFQNLRNQSLFQENLVESEWQQSFLLGIGKELLLTAKINLTVMILYDLNYKNNDLNPKPIVIRFGYRISELALW